MSDIMPKVKLYVLLSIISLFINLGTVIYIMITTDTTSLTSVSIGRATIVSNLAGSFIPFVSLISMAFMNLPTELFAIIGLFTGIISSIQSLIIVFMVLQIVSNLLWNPDV